MEGWAMEGLDVGDLVMGAMDYWVMDMVMPVVTTIVLDMDLVGWEVANSIFFQVLI